MNAAAGSPPTHEVQLTERQVDALVAIIGMGEGWHYREEVEHVLTGSLKARTNRLKDLRRIGALDARRTHGGRGQLRLSVAGDDLVFRYPGPAEVPVEGSPFMSMELQALDSDVELVPENSVKLARAMGWPVDAARGVINSLGRKGERCAS